MTPRRFFCLAAVAIKLMLPSPSHAGTYDVVACDAAPGGVNNSWIPQVTGGTRMRAVASCPSGSSPTTGLVASNKPGAGPPANAEQAWQKFWAPPGATVVSMTYTGGFWRPGSSEPGADDYQAEIAELRAGSRLDGCTARGGSRCVQWHTNRTIAVPNEPGVALVASCWGPRCREGVTAPMASWGNVGVSVRVTSATVRVSDTTLPAVSADAPDGWVRGTTSIAWGASDNVGVRIVRAGSGSEPIGSQTQDCDYTYAAPCPGAPRGSFDFDTRTVPDGERTVRVEAVDTAANGGAAEVPLRVDNTPPTVRVTGAGDPGTPHPRATTVSLSATDPASGMGGSGHVAYRVDGSSWATVAGDEAPVRVSEPGRHTITYASTDAAGNRSAERTVALTIAPGAELAAVRAQGFAGRASNPATFAAAARFAGACPAEATLRANRDASLVEAQPAAAFGAAPVILLAPDALTGFPLPAAPDCVVQSARLRMYVTAGAGRRVDVARAGSAWTEPTVTWSVRAGSIGTSSSAVTTNGWTEWDVTEQVAAIYRQGDNGLLLHAPQPVELCAREAAAGACAGKQPELILRFAE